jgi:class 3 adenylate cyclase
VLAHVVGGLRNLAHLAPPTTHGTSSPAAGVGRIDHALFATASGEYSRRADAPASRASTSGERALSDEETRRLRHDLRTPLNQIIGYAELLVEEATERGNLELAADLGKIVGAAHDLHARMEALLGGAPPAQRSDAPPASVRISVVPVSLSSLPPDDADADELVGAIAGEAGVGDGLEPSASVLVVDDDARNREMLERRLARHGYRVTAAADGYAALEALAASTTAPFDLLLLDVMMPGIDGVEVLRRIRVTHPASDLPVIMATARGSADAIVESLKLGANDHVTKPLNFPVVLARVRTQLALKAANDRVRKLARELEAKNRFIRDAFGRYVSDEIAETVLASPEGLNLGGETRCVSILMSDLRGFSALTESLPPASVVRMLNNYLGTMAEVISRFGGTIDEFIGDAILAVFGAPLSHADDAPRAVACAVAMQREMRAVNAFHREQGLPDVSMGIAVNTGEVVVGNIGSRKRTKYGVVGLAVNLTSRIESLTVGGQVFISSATLAAAGPIVRVGRSRTVRVKGAQGPLAVHEVLGVDGPYGLDLPDAARDATPLARPADVRFRLLEGKLLGDALHLGVVVALSPHGASIETRARLPELADVRIELASHDEASTEPAEIYAKVVDLRAGSLEVTFTYVSAEALRAIEALLRG